MKPLLRLLAAFAFVALAAAPAHAVFSFTSTGAATGFDFTCFSTQHCFASVNINSAGTEIFTSANPAQVTGANGTFPATQSGTWTVQPGNTANSVAWLVSGTGGTFPATQSGAWTVNPTTIGNWGLQVSTQNSATPTNAHLAEGQFNTSPTTITSGNVSPLQLDSAGNLKVNIISGAGSGGTAIVDNGAFTQGTTNETPMGCLFNTSYASATSAHSTVVSCTSTGSVHTTVDNANANVGNNADGVAVGASAASPVVNYNYLFNGTTWDRQRSSATTGASLQQMASQYPSGAIAITASATGTTSATTATLAGTAGKNDDSFAGFPFAPMPPLRQLATPLLPVPSLERSTTPNGRRPRPTALA